MGSTVVRISQNTRNADNTRVNAAMERGGGKRAREKPVFQKH